MSKSYRVVISGIQGYVGKELIDLVLAHPYLQLAGVNSRNNREALYKEQPQLAKAQTPVYSIDEINLISAQIDILLLATPANTSMEIVRALIHTKIIIIDLSGAFRLPEEQFLSWYGFPHSHPQSIKKACYGLSPWVSNQAKFKLIANPGCYATCALMAIIPLLNAKLIKPDSIIIDAKSGVSGSGKQANPDLMFCEMAGNFFPYKIGKHQHTPEIAKALFEITGRETNFNLTTHMLPIPRGISMSIYAKASCHFSSDEAILKALSLAMDEAYHEYPLIQYSEVGKGDDTYDKFILSLKNVVGTAYTHIGFFVKQRQIMLFASIDNLLKGAASQAIENINSIFQLPLQTGLLPVKEAL